MSAYLNLKINLKITDNNRQLTFLPCTKNDSSYEPTVGAFQLCNIADKNSIANYVEITYNQSD